MERTTAKPVQARRPPPRPQRSPFEWFLLALGRWNQFDGRSTRAEFWWFVLIQVFFAAIPVVLAYAVSETAISFLSEWFLGVAFAFLLATIVPTFAVAIRRLHDTNKPGWLVLIGIIPVVNWVGSVVLLAFYCVNSDDRQNDYGPRPESGRHLPQPA